MQGFARRLPVQLNIPINVDVAYSYAQGWLSDSQGGSGMVVRPFETVPPLPDSAADAVIALRDFVEKAFCKPDPPREAEQKDLPKLFEALRARVGTKNDFLTRDEIDRAIGDPRVRGDEALTLIALKKHCLSGNEAKVTAADVAAAAKDDDVAKTIKEARATISGATRTLYADNSAPLKSISHDAVVQAGIGNCYFYAALASLADLDPKSIANLIKDNKDGSYTVTFPRAKPITVQGPTDAELVLFPKPVDKGVWVHVLEKAYGEKCMNDSLYRALRKLRGMEESPIPQMHTDGGSAMDAGLKVLTDKAIAWTWSVSGPKLMHEALVDATTRGVPITTDTGLAARVENGPATMHVYSVLKYNKDSQVATIRNPWGDTVPKLKGVVDKGKGVFEIPLDVFIAHFTKISYLK